MSDRPIPGPDDRFDLTVGLNRDLFLTCQGCAGQGCYACGHSGVARRQPWRKFVVEVVRRQGHESPPAIWAVCSREDCGRPFQTLLDRLEDDEDLPTVCSYCLDGDRREAAGLRAGRGLSYFADHPEEAIAHVAKMNQKREKSLAAATNWGPPKV